MLFLPLFVDMLKDENDFNHAIVGFYAKFFEQHTHLFYPEFLRLFEPVDTPQLIKRLKPLGRKMAYKAIWDSRVDIGFLKEQAKKETPELKEWLSQLLQSPEETILDKPYAHSIADLDRLWGAFCESGDTKYVGPIIEAVPLFEDTQNPDHYLMGYSALWSLTSNAFQHKRVFDYLKSYKPSSPALVRYIQNILEKAQKNQPYFTEEEIKAIKKHAYQLKKGVL